MKLCCEIPGEDMDIFSVLNSERVFTQLQKGRIVGEFTHEGQNSLGEWYIADFPEETEYYIKFYECGGGMTKTGLGQIICGMKGEMLMPIRLFTTGHLANKRHAEFHQNEAIQISSTKNGIVEIVYAQIAKNDQGYIKIVMLNIWKGNIQYLPNTYNYFKEAIEAAYMKANDYHCRKAYYIQE